MTAVLAPERTRRAMVRTWTCAFCRNGLCGSCPGMVGWSQSGTTRVFRCECGKAHRPVYCRTCKNENSDEVNPETWLCLDSHVCHGRVQIRLKNNELWQMLQRCKSSGALARKRKREMTQLAESLVDPCVDELIDNQPGHREPSVRSSRPKSPPRPKTGVCQCGCAGTTAGGKFLPGHDAKLASALVRRVKSGDSEAYADMAKRGWLKKLPAALRSEWENKETQTPN